MLNKDSATSFDYLKRQYTIDLPKLFNPILRGKDNNETSVGAFSKSGISANYQHQGTLDSKEKGENSQMNISSRNANLSISGIPVQRHERTASFINKLPSMVRKSMNLDKDGGKLDQKEECFLRTTNNKRESIQANYS